MRIYKITAGDSRRYAYACGYRPFEGMSFFESMPENFRTRRIEFWALDPGEPGIHVDDAGSRWPDFMHCGNPPPSYFFSRKILESLERHSIPLKRVTLIPVGEIASQKLRTTPRPDYFVIETFPGISIDYEASGVPVDEWGNPDSSALRRIPAPILQLDPKTWTGADVFCRSNVQFGPASLEFLCTERVKEIAKNDDWTNVSFNRVQLKGIDPFTCKPYTEDA